MKKKYNYPEKLSIVNFFLDAEGIRKNPIPFHKKYFDKLGDTFSVKIGRTKHLVLSRDNRVAEYIYCRKTIKIIISLIFKLCICQNILVKDF